MTERGTHTLVNKHSGELAFKLYTFDSVRHFDHIQRLNYYSLIWIRKGRGKANVDFNSYEYSDNFLFSFSPYQPFMFEAETDTEGGIIHFHTDFFCLHKHQKEVACNGVLFNNIYDPPFVTVGEKSEATLEMLITEMERDLVENQMAMQESILSYLKLFLIHTSRLKNEQAPELVEMQGEETIVAQRLKDEIEKHYCHKHSPRDYADMLHISPKALAKVAKKHFNKTLTALISERIIIEAKRELYLTGKSVKEIALKLGYDDEFYFSRFFKKNTDITPSMFRKTVGFDRGNGSL